jgi:hypothetical protein
MKHHPLASAVFYAHVFLSFCALACVWGSWGALPQDTVQWAYSILIFAATILTYNVKSLYLLSKEASTDKSEKLYWANEHRTALAWSCVSAAAVVFLAAFYLPTQLLLCLSFLSTLAFGYFFPIPFLGITIRSVPFLKTAAVALVWTATTCYLPLLLVGENLSWQKLLNAGVLYYALAILFDVKDIQKDREKKIVTWATLLGAGGTLLLSSALLAARAADLVANGQAVLQPILSALLSIVVMAWVVKRYPTSELHYMLFVDGLLIVHSLG